MQSVLRKAAAAAKEGLGFREGRRQQGVAGRGAAPPHVPVRNI
jgi:hypothetical protein